MRETGGSRLTLIVEQLIGALRGLSVLQHRCHIDPGARECRGEAEEHRYGARNADREQDDGAIERGGQALTDLHVRQQRVTPPPRKYQSGGSSCRCQ